MDDKRKLKSAFLFIVFILLANTVVFHFTERWGWIDSFYFSGTTMTTIGYGDLVPTQPLTKIIITFDVLFSIGIFLYAITILGEMRLKQFGSISIPRPIRHAHALRKRKQRIQKMTPTNRKMAEIFSSKEERKYMEKRLK
ncbi:MAG: potassium channel family protein [Nanoarchaeota archaeon]|nr:potassium channel family protein [Nanoarchaeota archaeon]